MEIIWYGHACFRLKGKQGTVVTDPYDKSLGLSLPNLKADIITISHDSPHHNAIDNVKGEYKVVNSPGEYEINDIFVTAVNMDSAKNSSSRNIVYVIDLEEIKVCHMGDLNQVPNQSQVEDMGNIDVLLVPVGGRQALNATQAAEVISLIEPYMVIPMHYQLPRLKIEFDPVSKFLKEMGITKSDTVDSLKITQTTLPEETQIILLEAKQ